jgi:hypothetical protein
MNCLGRRSPQVFVQAVRAGGPLRYTCQIYVDPFPHCQNALPRMNFGALVQAPALHPCQRCRFVHAQHRLGQAWFGEVDRPSTMARNLVEGV